MKNQSMDSKDRRVSATKADKLESLDTSFKTFRHFSLDNFTYNYRGKISKYTNYKWRTVPEEARAEEATRRTRQAIQTPISHLLPPS